MVIVGVVVIVILIMVFAFLPRMIILLAERAGTFPSLVRVGSVPGSLLPSGILWHMWMRVLLFRLGEKSLLDD